MKSHARVCIIGGGAMGCGLLYYLAEEGWGNEIVMVEKGELTSGSTWHAAGQCPNFTGSLNLAKIHHVGTQLYPKLEELTGQAVSWHGCGGVRLALTDKEVDWFKHVEGIGKLVGFDCDVVGPNEVKRHHPYLEMFGVKAGFVTYTDGHVAPADVTMAMAAGARQKGAEIYRRNRCTDIRLLPTGEWEVITEKGNIICEHVVNAAGSYADVVGSWTGHNVPIANVLHHYFITEPVQALIEMDKELPVVRDPYSNCYLREETDGILIGPYETSGAHTCFDEGLSWDFENELVAPEEERLFPWLEQATERFPMFAEAGLKSVISGAITHTPDSNFLLGPAAGPRGMWMSNGSSIGICQGAGAGKYLAQWMVHGQAEINMAEFDPRRFGDWATSEYAKVTSINDYQNMYTCLGHGEQHEAGRPVRVSSLYDKLKAHGGQFQIVHGWERVRWFDPTGQGEDYGFRRSNWWDPVADECKAVRERVGLMDLSTFSKFDVTGRDAEALLDRLIANKVPRKTGSVTLAHILTDAGFMESEITITRVGDEHFYILSAAAAEELDYWQLKNAIREGEDVTITNVTMGRGTLVLSGPRARDVLAKLTDTDLSNANFRWLSAQTISAAGVDDIRALRVSYVGELGWELHCPMEGMPALFDALLAAGEEFGIGLFGAYAMNSLRMEKAYRGWGTELTTEIDMFEADMARFCRLDKGTGFRGEAASQVAKQRGPRIQLVYCEVDADDVDAGGNDPIFDGDKLIGLTTSGGYGHAVGKSLAFAYVEPGYVEPGASFEIEILGERRKANVIAQPAYDPENERLRA